MLMRIKNLIGLGGVYGDEPSRARLAGKCFERCFALIAAILLIQWHFEVLHAMTLVTNYIVNWCVWLFFVFEMLISLSLVRDRNRHLKNNWFKLFIIIVGVPLLFDYDHDLIFYQIIKPIFAIVLFVPWVGFVRRSLSDNRLLTTLITVFFTVIIAGVLMSGVDPGIHTPWEGIWWAWVTMSTVGYGDYVPVSVAGQVLACIVILIGLCFFAILTANFSRMFIRQDVTRAKNREIHEMRRLMKSLETIDARDLAIMKALEDIQARLDQIEKR
jgi:voltage-gated potassium channel